MKKGTSIEAGMFDTRIDRRGTQSIKWDMKEKTPDGRDVLPMWVADMDFPVPDEVIAALRDRLDHPVFGYSDLRTSHKHAFSEWQLRRNGWEIREEWLTFAPGVMPAVRTAILALTDPGDEVVIQPPVYFPFFSSVRELGRTLVTNPLVQDGHWVMDLDHLESVITARTRLLLLCSPHNPVARVWSRAELEALADVCLRHGVTVVSDEIHADLIRDGETFVAYATVSEEASRTSLTCAAPTKTFNLAGLASAFVIAADEDLRSRMARQLHQLGMDLPNILSVAAAEAAYSSGEPWLEALVAYLSSTFDWYEVEMGRRFPGIGLSRIEGTYLAWLDVRSTLADRGADETRLHSTLLERAGLWLSAGTPFGLTGFLRMNLGCPRSTVEEGLDRLEYGLGLLE